MIERRYWIGICCLLAALGCSSSTPEPVENAVDVRPSGVIIREAGVTPGYVLHTPLMSDTTYLVDNDGLVVHTWKSPYTPQAFVYLRDNGHLLRGAHLESPIFKGGGSGGRLEEYTWDGELYWSFQFPADERWTHHDVEILPNGNILAIAWERKASEEARNVGRRPEVVPEQGIWPGIIAEIEPTPPEGGNVVWEWHLWDHLIQNVDEELPNYGDPKANPHRIDINGDSPTETLMDAEALEQLKALGYVSDDTTQEDLTSDLMHINSVAYNAELDQIVLSTPRFSEIWIIDHSTTTAEAKGSTGGRWRRGGNLLYRWGNPSTYGRHEDTPRQLFAQHDALWVPEGYPVPATLPFSTTASPAPVMIRPIRRSSRSLRPSTPMEPISFRQQNRSVRESPWECIGPPIPNRFLPSSFPDRSASPTATLSSAKVTTDAFSKSPPRARSCGSIGARIPVTSKTPTVPHLIQCPASTTRPSGQRGSCPTIRRFPVAT